LQNGDSKRIIVIKEHRTADPLAGGHRVGNLWSRRHGAGTDALWPIFVGIADEIDHPTAHCIHPHPQIQVVVVW
jgi:hypothetical protein